MRVQLTQDWKGFTKGTILALPGDQAERLVASGVGVAPVTRTIPNDRMMRGDARRDKRTEDK